MTDQLYCLSNPDEPGLVRIAIQNNATEQYDVFCQPGERIDWSLTVRNAGAAMKALHTSMQRYRKCRGNGVYRCSPRDAHEIAARYTPKRIKNWGQPSQQARDTLFAMMLAMAFLASVVITQVARQGTILTLGLIATILAMLTIAITVLRDDRQR